jgi:hypothetical protein
MKIEVFRKHRSPDRKTTIGEWWIDGKFFCHALEDEVRAPGVKIYGETAIPAGTYKVALGHSNRYKRTMPRVLNVPMFEGILIHNGANITHTHGCLLVGHWDGEHWGITNSRPIFEKLFALMEAAMKRHEPMTLTIKNHPDWKLDAPPAKAAPIAAPPPPKVDWLNETVKDQAPLSASASPSTFASALTVKDRASSAPAASPQPAPRTGRSFLVTLVSLLFGLIANLEAWASTPLGKAIIVAVTLCTVVYLWRRHTRRAPTAAHGG